MIGNRSKPRLGCGVLFFVFFVKCAIAADSKNTEIDRASTDCGGEFSGYQYTISSPNYPEDYPDGQNCIYTLRGSPLAKCDQVFSLQFLDFSLTPSENCDEDYIEIGDRNLFCGKVAGIRTYPSKDNRLLLKFHSSSKHFSDKGFKILVTALPCTSGQIQEKIRGESTEQNSGDVDPVISVDGRSPLKNSETVSFLEDSHPIFRPNSFPSENEKSLGNEALSPPNVEGLDETDGNDLSNIHENPNNKLLSNTFELPIHRNKLFRDSLPQRSEIVNPAKVSAYLFVPPVSEDITNSVVTPPSSEILLPSRSRAIFNPSAVQTFSKSLPLVQAGQRSNGRLIVPAKTYGVPQEPYYPSFQGQAVAAGEVLDHPDCQRNPNLEPDLEVTANLRGKSPVPFTELKTGFGQTSVIQGTPVVRYPITDNIYTQYGPPNNIPNDIPANHRPNDWPVSNFGPNLNTNTKYVPLGNFPNNIPADYRPNDWPAPNFGPNLPPNVGAGFPGVIPSGWSECCRNPYIGRRFFITSPGFPSLFYTGNSYECIYRLIPFSANTCRMRFNFKFFNFGTEDPICSNGYVEIDGRRYCGCKKGLSVLSYVTSPLPKVIGVRYVGYPRTKFNGFQIEVIHETCSNGYPYNARSKKDVGKAIEELNITKSENTNFEFGNDSALNVTHRAKRNLGYHYPKPNFGLAEEPSHQWNSGNAANGNLFSHHGGNIFSPLLSCQAFSFFDWTIAAKESYLTNSRCLRNGNYPNVPTDNWIPIGAGVPNVGNLNVGALHDGLPNVGFPNTGSPNTGFPNTKCEDIKQVEGIISSPQYPINYPNYIRKCYRFYKAPDSCRLEISMLDFDLENSLGCSKDYVVFPQFNRRECGRSLLGKSIFIDTSRTNFVEMWFVTDGYGSGRGFNMGFLQARC